MYPWRYYDSTMYSHEVTLGRHLRKHRFKKTRPQLTKPLQRSLSLSISFSFTGLIIFFFSTVAAQTGVKIALLNSGSLRSDSIEPRGIINKQTVDTVLPFQDEVIVVRYTGSQLLSLLNNSVSQYPLLDGRFLQVAGLRFEFDPSSGVRHDSVRVLVGDGVWEPLDDARSYAVATTIFAGKDGYNTGREEDVVRRAEHALPAMFMDYLAQLAAAAEQDENVSVDDDGKAVVAPKIEGRIVCTKEDPELLDYYDVSTK